jgi:hypothetical protein
MDKLGVLIGVHAPPERVLPGENVIINVQQGLLCEGE